MASAPADHITPGLVTQPLSQEQWATLDKINEALTKEYTVRREMLLTRCDVTLQSFRWSERAKVSGPFIFLRFSSFFAFLLLPPPSLSYLLLLFLSSLYIRPPFLSPSLSQKKDAEISAIIKRMREPLKPTTHVSIARVLAAKSDLLTVERTNTGSERAAAQCDINKVLIGKVS